MTKIELVKIVSQKTGIDQGTVLAAVEGIVDTLKEALIVKENVYIRGWGTWTLKHRAKKTARNISKNTTLVIEAHDIPYFKPCKEFMDSVAAAK
jgi:DNA-binding protein HU-beta